MDDVPTRRRPAASLGSPQASSRQPRGPARRDRRHRRHRPLPPASPMPSEITRAGRPRSGRHPNRRSSARVGDRTVAFIPRHGRDHRLPPHSDQLSREPLGAPVTRRPPGDRALRRRVTATRAHPRHPSSFHHQLVDRDLRPRPDLLRHRRLPLSRSRTPIARPAAPPSCVRATELAWDTVDGGTPSSSRGRGSPPARSRAGSPDWDGRWST